MSNQRRVYFLAPTWDYAPDGGPIQLGNIITSPKKPDDPLNTHRHSSPPENALFAADQKYNLTWNKKKHAAGGFGIWTKLLSIFHLNFGISGESGGDSIYHFERVETKAFMPTEDYLREQMAAPLVLTSLRDGRNVYMITAVKIVYGAKAESARSELFEGQGKAFLDKNAAGLQLDARRQSAEGVAFEGSSPFVFAFRLRKVVVHEKIMSTEDYTKGAMFDADKENDADTMPFIAERVANSDATAEDFNMDSSETFIDDEEDFTCVVQ